MLQIHQPACTRQAAQLSITEANTGGMALIEARKPGMKGSERQSGPTEPQAALHARCLRYFATCDHSNIRLTSTPFFILCFGSGFNLEQVPRNYIRAARLHGEQCTNVKGRKEERMGRRGDFTRSKRREAERRAH